MIMKNEGPILPRLFESVQGFVSEYCIVDTGSTDDTIDVLKSIDMSGVLVEEPFVDFATTRNFLLDMCRARTTCDYLVLLDADMELKVSPGWDWAKLDGKDVYKMIQVSTVEYENVRIVKRMADRIKVVGATHEYYDVPAEYSTGLLPKHLVYIDDVGDGKVKGNKFERDERLLLRELEKEPDNVRTIFYLANTLKDQGKYREAIPFYEKRVAMGGWFAEADYSLYMLSACYLALDDVDNARAYAERAAFEVAVPRAEPLYFLALYLHRHDRYELAWHYATLAGTILKPNVSQALFISTDIYDYWVAYEQASLCCLVLPTESQLCKEKMRRFLGHVHAPDHLREYIKTELTASQRVNARRPILCPEQLKKPLAWRDEVQSEPQREGGQAFYFNN
jgi:tetratricopeptide (TPR) repeat protein